MVKMRWGHILLACLVVAQQCSLVVGLLVQNRAKSDRFPFNQATHLDSATTMKCSFSVEVMDTRFQYIPNVTKVTNKRPFLAAAMANLRYAESHGLDFRAVRIVDPVPDVSPSWNKIWYLRSRISDLLSKAGSTCRYIVYLDTDAWFQEILTPVDEWLGEIGQKYGISKDVAVIASKEEKPPDEQMRVQANIAGDDKVDGDNVWVNSGVLILRVSDDTVRLLEAVIRGGIAYDNLRQLHRQEKPDQTIEYSIFKESPREEGILTNLWNESNYGANMAHWGADADYWLKLRSETGFDRSKLAVIDMLEMNSPWGRFIQHEWVGTRTLMHHELNAALGRADLGEEVAQLEANKDVIEHMVDWNATEELLVNSPKELQPPVGSS